MTLPVSVRKQEDKIVPLFSYRLIPWLLHRSSIQDKETFYNLLQKLQSDIYKLDGYLESSWDLKEKVLSKKWERIFKTLSKFGIKKKSHVKWCSEIFVYQKQEVDLRKRKLPTRLALDEFYFYKSCDVKLMRRLLYRADSGLEKIVSYSDWMAFDYLTEVNDDIDDVFEDYEVYNCNRFLFSLFAFGKSQTHKDYRSFINKIQKNVEKRLQHESDSDRIHVLKQTMVIAENTKSLMKRRLKSKKLKNIAKARTIAKWKDKATEM